MSLIMIMLYAHEMLKLYMFYGMWIEDIHTTNHAF